jgi:hypothetical protein
VPNRLDKKRRKKSRTAAKQRKRNESKKLADRWPRIFFVDEGKSPAGFVSLFREVISKIDYSDPYQFHPDEAQFYQRQKQMGFKAANKWLGKHPKFSKMAKKIKHLADLYFSMRIGQSLFKFIGQEALAEWIPFNDAMVVPYGPGGINYAIQFRGLIKKRVNRQSIFISPNKPKIQVEGRDHIVSFTKHAIERTCERTVGSAWQGYNGLGHVFAFFHDCCHFEIVGLNGQLGFSFYNVCMPGFESWNYVESMVDNPVVKPWKYYYRVGYCPAVRVENYLVTNTLLFPYQ